MPVPSPCHKPRAGSGRGAQTSGSRSEKSQLEHCQCAEETELARKPEHHGPWGQKRARVEAGAPSISFRGHWHGSRIERANRGGISSAADGHNQYLPTALTYRQLCVYQSAKGGLLKRSREFRGPRVLVAEPDQYLHPETEMADLSPADKQKVAVHYQQLRQECQAYAQKIGELEIEHHEHT